MKDNVIDPHNSEYGDAATARHLERARETLKNVRADVAFGIKIDSSVIRQMEQTIADLEMQLDRSRRIKL